jgi:hypothetical protein
MAKPCNTLVDCDFAAPCNAALWNPPEVWPEAGPVLGTLGVEDGQRLTTRISLSFYFPKFLELEKGFVSKLVPIFKQIHFDVKETQHVVSDQLRA